MKTIKHIVSILFLLIAINGFAQKKAYNYSASNNYLNFYASADIAELLTIDDETPELPPDGRKPLLLIHGWNFDGSPAQPSGGYWNAFKNYILNDEELRANFKPYYVRYWSNYVSVAEIAEAFRDKLEEQGLHEEKIAIVAHSMGGLISRSLTNEQTFTSGISAGKKCGKNVDLLITLSTPHHGSPMANGPARNKHYGFGQQIILTTIESTVFSDTPYNEVNRSDLRWDNYNNLMDYDTYPNESNDWLANLNTITDYDSKLICYSGWVDGSGSILELNDIHEQYDYIASLIKDGFDYANDGIVPTISSQFKGHIVKKIRYFDDYDHYDIINAKDNQSELFDPLKEDLLTVAPLKLTSPSNDNIYWKCFQSKNIEWEAPETIEKLNIYLSTDNGNTYTSIGINVSASSGKYSWIIPDTNSTNCLIKIVNADFENEYSISENNFTIYHNQISINKPSAGDYIYNFANNSIAWEQNGLGSSVQITYHDLDNNTEQIIAESFATTTGANSYTWEEDESLTPTNNAKVKISILNMEQNYGDTEEYIYESDTFNVFGEPEFHVLSPSTYPSDEEGIQGEKLEVEESYTIEWNAKNNISVIELFLCDENKNILESLGTTLNIPEIDVTESTTITIPNYFGNTFYFKAEASNSENDTIIEAFSENSFRINQQTEIIFPDSTTEVSIFPCLEATVSGNPTQYTFVITNPSANECWTYISDSSGIICTPETYDAELSPGTTYQLSCVAGFDTINAYTDKTIFTTEETSPWEFELYTPASSDSTENNEINVAWSRSAAANGYRIYLIDGDNTVETITNESSLDTTSVLSLTNINYYTPATVKVSAYNTFGETAVSASIYKKWKTTVDLVETNNAFELCNYPNPCSDNTIFEFNLSSANANKKYSIELFNTKGQAISTIATGTTSPGTNQVNWDIPEGLNTGQYIYVLSIDKSKVGKTLMIK